MFNARKQYELLFSTCVCLIPALGPPRDRDHISILIVYYILRRKRNAGCLDENEKPVNL